MKPYSRWRARCGRDARGPSEELDLTHHNNSNSNVNNEIIKPISTDLGR